MIATVDISKAIAIMGFMTPAELEWLAEQAQSHHRIVEIGSHLGRSTRAMADNTPGWVMAFDDWRGPRDIFMQQDEEGNILGQCQVNWNPDALFGAFLRNVSDLVKQGKVKILRGDHADCSLLPVEFLRAQENEKPDMVFLDGSHEFEDVRRDILIWQTRIAKGGLLCGHDLSRPGVYAALVNTNCQWKQIADTDIWSVYV